MTASGSLSVIGILTALLGLAVPVWSDVVAGPAGAQNEAGASVRTSDGTARGSQYQHLPLGQSISDIGARSRRGAKFGANSGSAISKRAGAGSTSDRTGERTGERAGERTGGAWWDTLSALALVLVLIFGLRYVFLRWSGRSPVTSRQSVVEVLSRVSIAPRQQVVLLRLGNRILLVGHSSGTMCTLADVHDPREVASLLTAVSADKSSKAGGHFARLLGRYDDQNETEAARFNSEPDPPSDTPSGTVAPDLAAPDMAAPDLVHGLGSEPDSTVENFGSELATVPDSGGERDSARRGILDRLRTLATRDSA